MGAQQEVALWPASTLNTGRSVLLAGGVPAPQADAIVTSLQANDYRALRLMGSGSEETTIAPAPAGGAPRPTA